ncbi:MAG: 50S ribosomal protein L4 [Candidatus Zixiibacteriota bacterium]
MASAALYDIEGKSVGQVKLKDDMFGISPNEDVVCEYVKAYLDNQRQGTVCKKTRSTMRGGGAKPWRQKGTGRARAGTINSPIWVGGGRTFGPFPRDYRVRIPKRVKRLALKSAFSFMAKEEKIKIIQDIILDQPKTKSVVQILKNLNVFDSKCLLLDEPQDDKLYRSCRNIKTLTYKKARTVNPYDLLNSEFLVLTQKGLQVLEEVFVS